MFFFCGTRMEYCNCNFRWNSRGWAKAAVLWNFTLSSALALQKLVITLGLNGLLPGAPGIFFQVLKRVPCESCVGFRSCAGCYSAGPHAVP